MLASCYKEMHLACIEFIEYGTKLRYTLLVGNNLYVASCAGGVNVLELLIGSISILQCLLHSMAVKEIDYQGLLDREERMRVYENKL